MPRLDRVDVPDMPVLGLALGCHAVVLLILQSLECEAAKEHVQLRPAAAERAAASHPTVARAEQMAGEAATRRERHMNARDEVSQQRLAVEKEETKAGVDQLCRRQHCRLHTRQTGREAWQEGRWRRLAKGGERPGIPVDRQHLPTICQQRQRIPPRAGAEIDGPPAGWCCRRRGQSQRSQQGRPRWPSFDRSVVARAISILS